MEENLEKSKFFLYKEKPLVRKENVIYYGDVEKNFVAMLTIESSRKFKDITIGEKIILRLISTDPDISPQDVVVKHTVKDSLFEALDIAGIWIDRYTRKASI